MKGVFPDLKSTSNPNDSTLAICLTAGDEAPVERALERMMAMRIF